MVRTERRKGRHSMQFWNTLVAMMMNETVVMGEPKDDVDKFGSDGGNPGMSLLRKESRREKSEEKDDVV